MVHILFVDSDSDKIEYTMEDIKKVGNKLNNSYFDNRNIVSSKNINSIIISKLLIASNKINKFKIDKKLVLKKEDNSHIDYVIKTLNDIFINQPKIGRLINDCGSPKIIKKKVNLLEILAEYKENDLIILPFTGKINNKYNINEEILEQNESKDIVITPYNITHENLFIYNLVKNNKLTKNKIELNNNDDNYLSKLMIESDIIIKGKDYKRCKFYKLSKKIIIVISILIILSMMGIAVYKYN